MNSTSTNYIDPGSAKDSALACFDDAKLTSLHWLTGTSINQISGSVPRRPVKILWEKPQIYAKRKSKGNPNQLVDLAIAGAEAAMFLRIGWGLSKAVVFAVHPRDWKGTISKPVHHMRLLEILSKAELALFPAGTEAYIRENAKALALGKSPSYSAQCVDLLDATALGCYDLGRLSGPLAGKITTLKRFTKGRRIVKK